MKLISSVPFLKRMVDVGYAVMIAIILSAIVGLILAFPVEWLWNYVFGSIHQLNVFQAWALNVLIGILFSNSRR